MAKTATAEQSGSSSSEDRMQSLKSWPDRLSEFFRDVRSEMRKVTVPNRSQVQSTTVVVLITVFVFAFYFWLVDNALRFSLDKLIHNISH